MDDVPFRVDDPVSVQREHVDRRSITEGHVPVVVDREHDHVGGFIFDDDGHV